MRTLPFFYAVLVAAASGPPSDQKTPTTANSRKSPSVPNVERIPTAPRGQLTPPVPRGPSAPNTSSVQPAPTVSIGQVTASSGQIAPTSHSGSLATRQSSSTTSQPKPSSQRTTGRFIGRDYDASKPLTDHDLAPIDPCPDFNRLKRHRDAKIAEHIMFLIDHALGLQIHLLCCRLPKDFDRNFRDRYGRTPLMACMNQLNKKSPVMTALEPSFDYTDKWGRVPLAGYLQACRPLNLCTGDVLYYLNQMAHPERAYDRKKRNLLHFYCGFFIEDDPEPVEKMLKRGVSGRAKDVQGKNPIDLAIRRSMPDVVRTLLLHGVVPNRSSLFFAPPSCRAMVATALALERQVLFEIWVLKELAKQRPELTDVFLQQVKPYIEFSRRIKEVLERMEAYIEFATAKKRAAIKLEKRKQPKKVKRVYDLNSDRDLYELLVRSCPESKDMVSYALFQSLLQEQPELRQMTVANCSEADPERYLS